ncbi:MAG: hypothetical protein KKD18_06885 [Nanoarchaeota archaeon]|nr:hypothetical protein [Nanoarchaeota archaeon]
MEPKEQEAFWSWMVTNYGYWTAQKYRSSQTKLPFQAGLPATDEYYQAWIANGRPGFKADTLATRTMADITNEYAIGGLEDVGGRKGYIARIEQFFRNQVYSFAMTPEAANRMLGQIDEHVAAVARGEGKLEELPLFKEMSQTDFPQWEKYFTTQRKTYWGQMEEWSADVDKYNKEVAQSNQAYQQSMADWKAQRAEQMRLQQEAEDKQFQQRYGVPEEYAKGLGREAGLAGTFAEISREQPRGATQQPPDSSSAFEEAVGGLGAYTAQQYFGRRMGQVFQEFEQAFPGARGAWIQAMYGDRPMSEVEQLKRRIGRREETLGVAQRGLERYAERGMGQPDILDRPSGYDEELALTLMGDITQQGDILERSQAELAEARRRSGGGQSRAERLAAWQKQYGFATTEDPQEQYLKTYPFQQEFVKVPRRQRGFYPSASVSRARWFI